MRVKIGNIFEARRERKEVFEKYCEDVGIGSVIGTEIKYHLPDDYVVRLPRIGLLGEIRDRMVVERYAEYLELNKRLSAEINRVEEEIAKDREHLAGMQEVLVGLQRDLKAGSKEEWLGLQGKCENHKARMSNYKDGMRGKEKLLRSLQSVRVANAERWNVQVEMIEGALTEAINDYIYSATKMVRDKLPEAKFFFVMPRYGEDAGRAALEWRARGRFSWGII